MPGAARTRFVDVRRFDEIDSTNRYLAAEARAGAPEGVVAVARHQTAGRGRMGRTWAAPPGASLLASVLLRPDLTPERLHLVTMAASLAASDAVRAVAGFAPGVKWPNDLEVDGRKLAGLLAEADLAGARVRSVVVGIGINVNWESFPAEIAETATACNIVAGRPVETGALLDALLSSLEARYADLGAQAAEYRTRCTTLGRAVWVERPGGDVLAGVAVDVDSHGHLVVDTGDSVVTIAVGDVVHVRPAEGDRLR